MKNQSRFRLLKENDMTSNLDSMNCLKHSEENTFRDILYAQIMITDQYLLICCEHA